MKTSESNKVSPPYVPWETFKTFLKTIKDSAVPDRIDSSMMPPAMSGFSKAGVTTALRFFSLIGSDGQTKTSLNEIVDALESREWPEKVKKILVPAYSDIIGDLKVDVATRKQLDEKFKDAASQAMKDKVIRFYIPMLQDAGETISPYLMQRQSRPRKSGLRKTKERQKNDTTQENGGSSSTKHPPTSKDPEGLFDLPMMGITPDSFIRVPKNITPDQVNVVKAAADYLAVIAKQNEARAGK